jgi:hypothetical protein
MITVTPAAASTQSRRNERVAEQHDTINFGDIPTRSMTSFRRASPLSP